MSKIKAIIFSATLILIGSLLIYFESYKDLGNIWNLLIYLLILIGWILLYFTLFPKYASSEFPKRS